MTSRQLGRDLSALLATAVMLAACAAPAAAPTAQAKPAAAAASPAPVSPTAPAASPSAQAPGALSLATPGAPRTKVTAAWVAIAVTMLPALMALDGGYFDQQGLDVDMRYIAGSQNGVASMVSGEVQVLETAASAVVSSRASGGTLKMVAGFVNRPVFIALTTPAIKDPSQIKGTTWVVTGIGTSDYFGLVSMLNHFGLKPTDVTIVAANNTPGQIAAVQAGGAQGLLVSPPNDVQAQKQAGVKPFFDTSTLGVDEQNAGVAVTDAYGQAHPDVVERFIAACAQGIQRFRTDKPFAQQVMKKYLKYDDQEVLDSGWDHFSKVFEAVPYPSDSGTQRIIDQVGEQAPAAKSMRPPDVIDRGYVRDLEQRGFFRALGVAQ